MNLKIVLNQGFLFEPKKTPSYKSNHPKKYLSNFPTHENPSIIPVLVKSGVPHLGFKNARKPGMLSTGEERAERASLFTPFSTGN